MCGWGYTLHKDAGKLLPLHKHTFLCISPGARQFFEGFLDANGTFSIQTSGGYNKEKTKNLL